MKKFVTKLLKFISTLIVLAIVFFVLINLLLPLKYDRINGCDGEKKLLMEENGRYIYTLCMDNVKVRNWFNEIPLKDYITNNKNWYKKIKPLLYSPTADDVYADSVESISYRVIECHSKKNNNIYIMPLYTTSIGIDCTKEEKPDTLDVADKSENSDSNTNNKEGE